MITDAVIFKTNFFATSLEEVAPESPGSIRSAKLQGKPHLVCTSDSACPEPYVVHGLAALTDPAYAKRPQHGGVGRSADSLPTACLTAVRAGRRSALTLRQGGKMSWKNCFNFELLPFDFLS